MTVACPTCGKDLQPGPDGMVRCECGFQGFAGYVQEHAYLTARLAWLNDRLAEGAGPPDPATARAYGLWSPPPPKRSASPQILLVTVGAVLLVLAGLVFVAVAWDTIGPWGQIGSLLGLTILLAVAAIVVRTKTSGAAEALAAVSFCLGLICGFAAPALGAVPEAWDSGRHPYRLIVAVIFMAWGVLLGRRFGLQAWTWLGWLLTPAVIGFALILGTRWVVNDQVAVTASGLIFLAAGMLLLWTAKAPDLWPMRAAGIVNNVIALLILLRALAFDPPTGAVLLVAAALLITVVTGLDWVGWPLFGFWLGLLALFLPQGTATTVGVGLAGVALLFALHGKGAGLATISAFTLWTTYVLATWWHTLVVTGQGDAPKLLALIAGVGLLAFSLRRGAAPIAWFGAVLVWIAFMLQFSDFAFVELPLLVLAALLLAAGLVAQRAGMRNSGIVYGPALTVALVPSAFLCWWRVWETPSLIRFALVMVFGVSLLVIGVHRHMLGLVVPATVAVSIAATAQIVATLNLLPRWLALAVAGGLLIAVGARIEWVRARGRDTEEWLQTLK